MLSDVNVSVRKNVRFSPLILVFLQKIKTNNISVPHERQRAPPPVSSLSDCGVITYKTVLNLIWQKREIFIEVSVQLSDSTHTRTHTNTRTHRLNLPLPASELSITQTWHVCRGVTTLIPSFSFLFFFFKQEPPRDLLKIPQHSNPFFLLLHHRIN